MRWMKRVNGRLWHEERGANAVLIALLFIPMMAFGALAFDISAQHAERTTLQHGADAAALAIAKECGKNESTCSGSAAATGNAFIDGNQSTPVAGQVEITSLDLAANKVSLAARAEFPHFFASLIDGDDDPGNTTVRARAEAVWGSPIAGSTIPLAIADCELTRHFNPTSQTSGEPFILMLIGSGNGAKKPADCAPGYPGGFGWLQTEDLNGDGVVDCGVNIEVGVPENGVPGKSDAKADGCPDDYLARLLGETILIALYDSYTADSSGNKGSYNISRFAAFTVTGYHIASGSCSSPGVKVGGNCYLPGQHNAPGFKGGEFGLQGHFVRYVDIGEEFELGDAPDGGLSIVRLTG